jgi:hypothetical protein
MTNAIKPVGEHRTAVLQVTDIFLAELDEEDFCCPRTASSTSGLRRLALHVRHAPACGGRSRALQQALQLGQYVLVNRLDPASQPTLSPSSSAPGCSRAATRSSSARPIRSIHEGQAHLAAQGLGAPSRTPPTIEPTTLNFDSERMMVKEQTALSTPLVSNVRLHRRRAR